jgi:CPA2 family monovalent cation:H+ antiporter-2
MMAAGIVTFLFHKLKQPLILGYLIAGILIGPYTPPYGLIKEFDVLQAVANLGVILLLFGVGLEFPIAKLRRIGFRVYLGISLIEILFMFLVSFGIGWILHWSLIDSLFLGAALASSSTVIIAKVLEDMGKLKDISALVMMGILIVEDLIVVTMLALIISMVGSDTSEFNDMTLTLGKIILFIVGAFLIGMLIIPRIIDKVAHPESDDEKTHIEVLILVALGLCFTLSIIGNLIGLSLAIGAFLMGVFIASAKSAEKVATLTSPIKIMFAAMFFVSMGALIDITQFQVFLPAALLVTATMVVGKIAGVGIGTRIFGFDKSISLRVGLGMGQIGEFAFIVVNAGQALEVVNPVLFPTIAVSVAITAFLTPYLIKFSYRITPDNKMHLLSC